MSTLSRNKDQIEFQVNEGDQGDQIGEIKEVFEGGTTVRKRVLKISSTEKTIGRPQDLNLKDHDKRIF